MCPTPQNFKKVTKINHNSFCFGPHFGSPKSTKFDKNASQKTSKKRRIDDGPFGRSRTSFAHFWDPKNRAPGLHFRRFSDLRHETRKSMILLTGATLHEGPGIRKSTQNRSGRPLESTTEKKTLKNGRVASEKAILSGFVGPDRGLKMALRENFGEKIFRLKKSLKKEGIGGSLGGTRGPRPRRVFGG